MATESKIGPRDVFGQLLSIIGLYASVIAFVTLIFGLIDIYFPDVLNYYGGFYNREAIRWPLATLTVVFPLYLWFTSYLHKDFEKHPEKKELKSRKWLLHFTLFAAAIVIVGDLITLIYRFLNGDLTIQFILKVLTVLVIASAVFIYYLWLIRKNIPASRHPKMKWFIRIVGALGIFFIIFGFVTAGSPFSQRMRRFDQRRVQDLQVIQSETINYWQSKRTLPQNIDQLRDEIKGFIPPKDPETGAAYEYRVLGPLKFELCATFKTSNKDEFSQSPSGHYPVFDGNWLHDVGRTCFERTIDPDIFPPRSSKEM